MVSQKVKFKVAYIFNIFFEFLISTFDFNSLWPRFPALLP
jgi:hypothetical protein